jgi:hypothetical protein
VCIVVWKSLHLHFYLYTHVCIYKYTCIYVLYILCVIIKASKMVDETKGICLETYLGYLCIMWFCNWTWTSKPGLTTAIQGPKFETIASGDENNPFQIAVIRGRYHY